MSAFTLRIIALLCMFVDHTGRIILPEFVWMTYIGRLAFPIFAFQLVEGYMHSRDKKRYALRLFFFAIVSEIPFDLMAYGTPVYWGHQNIMWTLLFGFICIFLADNLIKHLHPAVLKSLADFVLLVFFFTTATAFRFDYLGFGILQIYLFYKFHNRKNSPSLITGTILTNVIGATEPYIYLAGLSFPSQILASFALIPIYFYNGSPGYRTKLWSFICYAAYPLHMMLLVFLKYLIFICPT